MKSGLRTVGAWLLATTVIGVSLGGCASTPGSKGGGTAVVVYVNPQRFTDISQGSTLAPQMPAELLADLEAYIKHQAEIYLPADRRVELNITDIKQAGLMVPARGRQLRVVGNTPPARAEFDYQLKQSSGEILKSGHEVLSDFPNSTRDVNNDRDPMPVVKRMFRDWMRRIAKSA